MFFDDLKNKKLKRNEDNFYTLEDEGLDRLFGINNVLTLTPNEENIANFAAINYFFGLFGINVESFTAVPSGYLASYNKDNEFYGTFWIDPYYITNEFIKLCDEKINNNENSNIYTNIKMILLNNSLSLLKKSLLVSSYINKEGISIFNDKLGNAIKIYEEVNNKNCNDNHQILREVVANDQEKYDELLNYFILPGYLHYRGYDRDNNKIDQRSQILNDVTRIDLLMKMLNYDTMLYYEKKPKFKDIISILNMCSTDYSADMAYNLFKSISKIETNIDINNVTNVASELMINNVPLTPNNEKEKSSTRNSRRY